MTETHQAIRIGRISAVAHTDGEALRHLADQLSSRGYRVQETPHFVVCQKPLDNGRAIVMHTFNETTVDADLFTMVPDELAPLGIAASAQEYGDTICAIVASTRSSFLSCPQSNRVHVDPPTVWRHFCLNTLRRLRPLLAEPRTVSDSHVSHIVDFAAVYRRIIDYCTGASLLDIGCNLGFLPVVLAEHFAGMTIVGCDSRQDLAGCAADLASATHTGHVSFMVRDVLAPDFPDVGRFDTVTAVHLLEHLAEEDLAAALTNMLSVAARRLIIAVPYEDQAQALHGHEQAFTSEKLHAWGRWCVETLGGGRFRCENVSGGLLVVDLPTLGTGP